MGCIDTITYDKFPKQKDENYKYPEFKVGSRVEVCYHFDTSKYHYGTIVRDDLEEPFETIIKLDNGRYLRAVECQYSYIDEEVSDNMCEWKKLMVIVVYLKQVAIMFLECTGVSTSVRTVEKR